MTVHARPFLLSLISSATVFAQAAAAQDAGVLAVGDSFMAYNAPESDIATVAADQIGMTVASAAVGGTTMMGGEEQNIPSQYRANGQVLVIASGGGNDLGESCFCGVDCEEVVDQLIDEDASSGAIVSLVEQAISDGAYVAWVGYMRPMPDAEAFQGCEAELDELARRLAILDESLQEMVVVNGAEIGTGEEEELYDADGYHPSATGSEAVGTAVAERLYEEYGE